MPKVGKDTRWCSTRIFLTRWGDRPEELDLLSPLLLRLLYVWLWTTDFHHIRFTNLLTPCSRVLLDKLTCSQLVKTVPSFHGTQRFITAFTSTRQLSLSWTSSIQSILPHPTSWRSILILHSHLRLGLPSGLFPSGFLTKTLYTPLLSPIRATCPTPHIHSLTIWRLTATIWVVPHS